MIINNITLDNLIKNFNENGILEANKNIKMKEKKTIANEIFSSTVPGLKKTKPTKFRKMNNGKRNNRRGGIIGRHCLDIRRPIRNKKLI